MSPRCNRVSGGDAETMRTFAHAASFCDASNRHPKYRSGGFRGRVRRWNICAEFALVPKNHSRRALEIFCEALVFCFLNCIYKTHAGIPNKGYPLEVVLVSYVKSLANLFKNHTSQTRNATKNVGNLSDVSRTVLLWHIICDIFRVQVIGIWSYLKWWPSIEQKYNLLFV